MEAIRKSKKIYRSIGNEKQTNLISNSVAYPVLVALSKKIK
jgi:hypothetical protein